MPTPRWKLADDQSLEDYSLGDDAASLGEFFATAITDGTGVFNSSRTVKYDKFRKTFWEEPIYNPEINHGHLSDHVYEYLDKEQKKAWNHSGHKWSLSSDVRFRDNAYENPGPQKPERFPQCFEMPSKYWGRERKINPYARAKVYTRPNDRCKPWAKLVRICHITLNVFNKLEAITYPLTRHCWKRWPTWDQGGMTSQTSGRRQRNLYVGL